jgi:CBS domain-containing protein
MAGMHEQKLSPKAEFQMAIAGPAFSLLLSGVFLAVYNIVGWFYVAAVASYLYRINLILAIFNLVPGFPLDGGRVLRSIVWYWTKDFKKATRIATTAGKFVAYFLIFSGFMNMITGNAAGVWFLLIGFFLLLLSTLSYEQVVIKDALAGKMAADFVDTKYASIGPGVKLREAVVKHFLGKDADFIIVKDKEGFHGLVSAEQVHAVPKKYWAKEKVHGVMIPAKKIPKVKLHTGAYAALTKMLKSGLDFLPVVEKNDLKGIIRRTDLLRYVKLKGLEERAEKMGFRVE